MNSERPGDPREELELRVTALLLGELSGDEAAAVREAVAKDPEVTRLHDDLKQTIHLIRQATANAGEPATEQASQPTLSEARRKKLLTHFAIPPLKETDRKPKPLFQLGLLEWAAVLTILVLLATVSIPALRFAKSKGFTAREDLTQNDVLQISRRSRGVQREAREETISPVAQPRGESNVHLLNVVGYINLPTDLRSVTLGAAADGSPASQPSTSVGLPMARGSLEQAGTPLAPPPPEASVAALAPTTPVLESLGEVAVTEGSQGGGGTGGGGAGGLRFFTNTSFDAAGAVSTPLSMGGNYVALDSFSVVPNTPAIDPSTGLPMKVESGLERADGVASIPRGLNRPGVIALTDSPVSNSGFLALDETRRLAEVDRDKAPVLGNLPNVGTLFRSEQNRTHGTTVGGSNYYTNNGQSAQLGVEEFGRASAGFVLYQSAANTSLADLMHGPSVRPQSTIVSNGQTWEFAGYDDPGQFIPQGQSVSGNDGTGFSIQAQLPMARYRLKQAAPSAAPQSGERVGEKTGVTSPTAPVTTPKPVQQQLDRATAEKLAGSLGEGKSSENFGAIVLPATPEENLQPADAKKPKLATVPSRLLRLPPGEQTGEREPLEKKIASVQQETKGQSNKPDSSSGFRTGLTQTDVLAAGRLGSDMITREQDALDVEMNQPYYQKKRELDEATTFARILGMKLEAEKIDRSLPKTSMVEIMDQAQPAKEKTGFWRSLGAPVAGSFASTARVKVQQAVTDIEGMAGSRMNMGYDPFFIQTEFEAIRSDAVLGKVVDGLKLDEAWAANRGGEKLNKAEAIGLLKSKLDLKPVRNTSLVEIQAKSDKPDEAAKIANAVAEAYTDHRQQERIRLASGGIEALEGRYQEQQAKIRRVQAELEALRLLKLSDAGVAGIPPTKEEDHPVRRASTNAPIPQPEIQTSENNFSTFSLNVSDVSFKLAAASLEKGQMPDAASVRSEEFINAFDYRDPEPAAGAPIGFAWERVRYPFAHNRDLLRFSLKTAAAGRQAGRPLNIVLLLDNSGSMERADRVSIIREALRVLASQLQPQDKLSVITFARTARLVADGISGDKAGEVAEQVSGLTPQGGTNLEDAMHLAYQTAARHYLANGINRVVLLTDGAANLGDVEPESLKQKVEAQRKQGIALDCFGIGWEGLNDDLLEVLSRNGDGRYGFINSPEEAATDFAGQLAGALKVAASDVKVQVEFNPKRVTAYRQIGYAKHQLTKEQFRDNTVDAAEIAAQEAGNALYTVEVNPAGEGPLGTVRVRFKIPGTTDYREQAWDVPYTGNAVSLEQSSPAMRLAATASAFSEWLVASPFAGEVTLDRLISDLSGVPKIYGADARPKKLEWMLRQAKSIAGKQ